MRITVATEYALRAILHMASNPERSFSTSELCTAVGSPQKFLAKIMQKLTKSKILKSSRGVRGGFTFNVHLQNLTILKIVEAVDGPLAFNKCLLTGNRCPRKNRCPIHDIWKDAQSAVAQVLVSKNFKELADEFTGRQ